MKQKVLLSACALAACLTACNNEDLLVQQPANGNANAESSAVIGADLASRGMNIILSDATPGTRATNGAWSDTDQFGLGWFRFNSTAITGEQDFKTWQALAVTGYAGVTSDRKLYANHIFTYNGGDFTTQSDVYQGAYFVYWPFERLGGVKDKALKVNSTPQTGDFDSERFNKALHLSAQDFIEAEEGVDPETNTLTKEFFLTPVVNVLAVQASPEAAIAESENEDVKFLQGFNITQVQINAGATPTDVFVDGSAKGTATLIPSQLPKVVRTSTGDIDVEKTIEG